MRSAGQRQQQGRAARGARRARGGRRGGATVGRASAARSAPLAGGLWRLGRARLLHELVSLAQQLDPRALLARVELVAHVVKDWIGRRRPRLARDVGDAIVGLRELAVDLVDLELEPEQRAPPVLGHAREDRDRNAERKRGAEHFAGRGDRERRRRGRRRGCLLGLGGPAALALRTTLCGVVAPSAPFRTPALVAHRRHLLLALALADSIVSRRVRATL
jgi:hypothetical protein